MFMLCTDPLQYQRHIYPTGNFFGFFFSFLHKNNFKERQCILWWYQLVSYLINIHSLKRCLQKFKIVNILMLQLCLKFYFLQTNAAWKQHVHELAIGSSWKEKSKAWVSRTQEPLRLLGRQEPSPLRDPLGACAPLLTELHLPVPSSLLPEVKGADLPLPPCLSTVALILHSPEHQQLP